MPLVVPGLNTSDIASTAEDWSYRLLGKKIGDKDDGTHFEKNSLPEGTRILRPGDAITMDFNENRLNVHVTEDGTVARVDYF